MILLAIFIGLILNVLAAFVISQVRMAQAVRTTITFVTVAPCIVLILGAAGFFAPGR